MKKTQRKTRYLSVLAAGIVAVAGLSAMPGPAHAATVTNITFWTSGSTDGVAYIVDQFNKAFADKYHIEFRAIPYANETTVVNSALTAHRGPELMEESLTFSTPYAVEGLEMPILPFLKMAGIDPAKDFPKAMWDGTTVSGVHYVAPTDGLPTMLFWNKALFRKAGLNPNRPPRNEQQFVADAKKLTDAKIGQWGYIQEPAWPAQFFFPSLLGQFGGREANPAKKQMLFDSPAGIKALTFMYDAIYKWHISPRNASPHESYNLFLSGKNAMMMTGAYDFPATLQKLGKNLGFSILPKIGTRQADFLGQNYWWVFRNPGLNPATDRGIATFMKFFYTHSLELAKAGVLPVWQPTLKSKAFREIPGDAAQARALQTGILNPLITGWGTAGAYLYSNINDALIGKMPIKEALVKAAQEMHQTLYQSLS